MQMPARGSSERKQDSVVTSRVELVQSKFHTYLAEAQPAAVPLAGDASLRPGSGLQVDTALALFEDQVTSRLLDVAARDLKAANQGFYTIASAGHEQNAVIGALLRLDDPCFLHYRSGALMMARARKLPGSNPILDTLLSLCASSEDPITQGRHKIWGSRALWVPPQTSTIASHLPKALGFAFALSRARRLGKCPELSDDSLVCCSFGDASVNHATALAGINSARYAAKRGVPVPILFVCEDNGVGISVPTPHGWIRETFGNLPHLQYFEAGGEIDEIWDVATAAIDACRTARVPVFLHLHCVRLWGHAGSDVETTYRSIEEIQRSEEQDPLLRNAHRLVETGAAPPSRLQAIVRGIESRIAVCMEEAMRRPKLVKREDVMAPLAPYEEAACRKSADVQVDRRARRQFFADAVPEESKVPSKKTLGAHINAALADEMLRFPEILVFGEDVGKKGGVYYVTAGLQWKFGIARVFDTLLDETTILGLAQGAGMAGLLPIPEIQYLAYIHNALDQLRGEACSLSFFSSGQFRNPMVVRVASLAYQKGFGGHFHNDNSVGALRDIPGLLIAVPSRGDEAALLLRGAVAAAQSFGRVVVYLEPIALYHEKDLYRDGDGKWLFDYPPPGPMLLPGEVGVYHQEHSDLAIVSYANGLRLSLRAARVLKEKFGILARVIDLRWLNPLPIDAIEAHAHACGRILVADECRATGGGIADAIIASLAESGFAGRMQSVRSADSFVPLAKAAEAVLLSEGEIVEAAQALCSQATVVRGGD